MSDFAQVSYYQDVEGIEGDAMTRTREGNMRGDFDEDEDPDFEPEWSDYDEGCCSRCDGQGVIVVCIDDMCRGLGECIHGDGEIVCPDCKGGD